MRQLSRTARVTILLSNLMYCGYLSQRFLVLSRDERFRHMPDLPVSLRISGRSCGDVTLVRQYI